MLLEIASLFVVSVIFCYWIVKEKYSSEPEITGMHVSVKGAEYSYRNCVVVKTRSKNGFEHYICSIKNVKKLIKPTEAFYSKLWDELLDLDIYPEYITICNENENIVVFQDGEMKTYKV